MIVDRPAVRFKPCDETAMLRIAAGLAQPVRAGHLRVLTLSGELGAGKTSFARGLLQALGVTGRIKSPSFAVAERYDLDALVIHHIDLYRLTDPHAWRSAGLREAFAEGLVVVEWPEHGHGLPSPDLAVRIDWADPQAPEGPRLISAHTDQQALLTRLEDLASEAPV
jgi:tRNA threonylcarbamoyl adenosine modification protein YjeE